MTAEPVLEVPRHPGNTPLGRAVIVHARILGSLVSRLLERRERESIAAWVTPSGALVIVAIGHTARRIAGELERAGILTPQIDNGRQVEPRP